MATTSERDELHGLVDKLPDSEVAAAIRFLRDLQMMAEDPVLRAAISAPLDDEPVTPEQQARVREAEEAAARGEVVRLEDLARELGL